MYAVRCLRVEQLISDIAASAAEAQAAANAEEWSRVLQQALRTYNHAAFLEGYASGTELEDLIGQELALMQGAAEELSKQARDASAKRQCAPGKARESADRLASHAKRLHGKIVARIERLEAQNR
mgnify:CR=1 FL=1